MKRKLTCLLVLCFLTGLISGCSTSNPSPPGGTGKARIDITSNDAVLLTERGQTEQFKATVYRQDGSADTAAKVSWSSSNPAVIRIDSNGVATALSEVGYAWITASYHGLAARASVSVAQPAARTKVIEREAVLSANAATRLLTLRATAATSALQPGDIVASDAGVLARVTSVKTGGNQVLVGIAPVGLLDAFDKVSFGGTTGPIAYTAIASEGGLTVQQQGQGAETQQFITYGQFDCKSDNQAVSISYEGPSMEFAKPTIEASFSYEPLEPETYLELYVAGELSLTAATGNFRFSGKVGASVTCSLPLGELSLPVASFMGVLNIAVTVSPVIGFEGQAAYDGGSFTVEGPEFDIGYMVKAGARYSANARRWFPYNTANRTGEGFTFKSVENELASAFAAEVGPFLSLPVSIDARAFWFNITGVQFVKPELRGVFSTGISGPLDKTNASYEGPYWEAFIRASAGLDLRLTGALGQLLDYLKVPVGFQADALIDATWPLAASAEPAISVSPARITDSSTLTATVPASHAGDRVEFWALKSGAASAVKLAETTVDASGQGRVQWYSEGYGGSYEVIALLYADVYKLVDLPYASSQRADITVTAGPPASAPQISGTVSGLPAASWRATILYPSLLSNPSRIIQVGHKSAAVGGDGSFTLGLTTPPNSDSRVQLTTITPPGSSVSVNPTNVQGAEFSLVAFNDSNGDAQLGAGEVFYLLNDSANTFGQGALNLQYANEAYTMSGQSTTSSGTLVNWQVNASEGWGRTIYVRAGNAITVSRLTDLSNLNLRLGAQGTITASSVMPLNATDSQVRELLMFMSP